MDGDCRRVSYGFEARRASRLPLTMSHAAAGTVTPLWQSTQTHTFAWTRLYTTSILPPQIGHTSSTSQGWPGGSRSSAGFKVWNAILWVRCYTEGSTDYGL